MDSELRAGVIVLGSGFFGVVLAAILYVLHERGTFVDEWTQSATFNITELMVVVIILFLIIGVLVAMLKS